MTWLDPMGPLKSLSYSATFSEGVGLSPLKGVLSALLLE